jgi:hypothetical protein
MQKLVLPRHNKNNLFQPFISTNAHAMAKLEYKNLPACIHKKSGIRNYL